ncbi:hypothetical protein DL96DRAFT_65916 [Flagelloscypha sp. PMI_526]|nr:hypothetical protein DL96DRAFT_65916 [Flagelloscypha sp. PMI_526]
MSYTNWGMNEPTQDTIHFKNKISSQDAQLAAQQSQLLKQADELKQLQINLSDASAKLAVETNKNIGLGNSLARCKNDLVQERTILANTQMSLTSAQVRIKESEHEARSLQVTLESFSQSSGSALSRLREAEKDKEAARSRVLELESQVRHLTSLQAATQATPSSRNRSRSSSLSTVRISSLESETNDLRHNITQKDVHITDLTARLSSALAERNQAQNERIAVERKLNGEISDLKSHLEDRDDEMAFLRDQTRGSGARELELMQRIDEDAERIGSLELLLRSEDPRELRSQVTYSRAPTELRDNAVISSSGGEGSRAGLTSRIGSASYESSNASE